MFAPEVASRAMIAASEAAVKNFALSTEIGVRTATATFGMWSTAMNAWLGLAGAAAGATMKREERVAAPAIITSRGDVPDLSAWADAWLAPWRMMAAAGHRETPRASPGLFPAWGMPQPAAASGAVSPFAPWLAPLTMWQAALRRNEPAPTLPWLQPWSAMLAAPAMFKLMAETSSLALRWSSMLGTPDMARHLGDLQGAMMSTYRTAGGHAVVPVFMTNPMLSSEMGRQMTGWPLQSLLAWWPAAGRA